ncbi:epsin-3-like [Phoenix dactylifera]|uniref:Epsin-3-like n=1 Tax=Phoenix dactylifera TaxID=42345 RepID=A0A8B7D517_PHODC|nr:epsin-3-like [Phoenix dactylifera]
MNLSEIKKQASSFLQEKYKSARLVLTDATQAEILAEEATNSDVWGPDAKTMTRISEAAYDMDDYWRIVDVLHRRLRSVYWKEWRQSYKTLVLLEFLLTHGPEEMFEEFHCDINVIQELGKLNYVDERGFNWGACMQNKSERILRLLSDEKQRQDARSKALKISKEIQGFGNLIVSPSSSSSSTPSSSKTCRSSSFGSYSLDSPTWNGEDDQSKQLEHHIAANKISEDLEQGSSEKCPFDPMLDKEVQRLHLWDSPIKEDGSLFESTNEDKEGESDDRSGGFCSRLFGTANQSIRDNNVIGFRSLSDVGKVTKKKIDRQFSHGF